MTESIVQQLYAQLSDKLLYHYTGYPALLSIAKSSELWATEIHYFNDASELTYATNLFKRALEKIEQQDKFDTPLLSQLRDWLTHRLADGHMLFVCCFTENGNLLSQWRGYTPHGNGVSLGFEPKHLLSCAAQQGYRFGKCIYDQPTQEHISISAIEAVLTAAAARGPESNQQAHPSQSFHHAFAEQEAHLLQIAALLKNPAFEAEHEWRAVSAISLSHVADPAQYRAGRSTLIPYKPLQLSLLRGMPLKLAHAYLGPTSENNLAMRAFSTFLAANRISPCKGVSASQLPYRET